MERIKPGIIRRKSFRYPVIIPVVYYEGKASWSAERSLRGRISKGDMFAKWMPDFTYEVIQNHAYKK